jgi:hypothetical protein
MAKKRKAWRFETATGEVLKANCVPSGEPISNKRGRTLIAIKPSRFPIMREAMESTPYLEKEMWAGIYSFPWSKVKFDNSPPRKGDMLAIVRQSDGKVLRVTAPLIQVGVNGLAPSDSTE